MSSVSVEASLNSSNRAASGRSAHGTSAERRTGFSTLVDSNLSAANDGDRSERPAPSAPGDRTSTRPSTTDRTEAPRTEARDASTPAETATGTRVERTANAEKTDTTAAAEKTETDGEATEAKTTTEADAAAQAAEAGTITSIIDSNDAIPVTNPPATVVQAPAETAAAALNRVAADTALDPVSVTAAAAAANAATDAEVEPVPQPTEIKAEGEIKGEKVTAQVEAKAQNDLATPGKPTDVTPEDAQQHGKLTARTEVGAVAQDDAQKPTEAPAELRKAGSLETRDNAQPTVNAERADTNAAKPARPAHEQTAATTTTPATHAPAASDLLQSNGFGLAQVAPSHQTAAVQAPQLTAVAATNIPVPVNGLAVEIVANAQIGRSRFEIRLDPPELGRIDVRLDVDKQGQVTSHLIVEKSSTLDMLRRDAPQLERALQDAGLKTSDSGLQFSLRDQSQSHRNDDNDSGRNAHRLHIVEDEPVAIEPAARGYGRMIGQRGGIDIRV